MTRQKAWGGLVAALAAAAALRAGLVPLRYFDTDELVHLHAALLVSNGNVPFRDFFAHHGPLFWAALAPVVSLFDAPYAQALAGRAFMTLAWVFALLLTARQSRDDNPLEGTLAAAWLAFFAAFAQKSLEVRPDGLASALLLGAMAFLGRRSRWSAPLAGLLLGLAGWCSLKAAFPAAGLVAGATWSLSHSRGYPAGRFLAEVMLGAAIAAFVGIAFFTAFGAGSALWDHYIVYNAGFPRAQAAWAVTLLPSLKSDPAIWLLGLAGLRRWRQRPAEAGALSFGLAGLGLSPSAYPQYLLLVAPFLARLAVSELADWVRRAPRARGVAAAAVLALAWGLSARGSWRLLQKGNELQRARWECAARLPPTARVWDAWSGDAFTRPHAAGIWFVPDDAQAYYEPGWLESHLAAALADRRTVAAVRCESCLERLPSGIRRAFDRYFEPSGCGRLWRRQGDL